MSSSFDLIPQVVMIPLRGRASVRVTLAREIPNDVIIRAYICREGSVTPIVTRISNNGTLIVTDSVGEIYFDIPSGSLSLFSASSLYHLLVQFIDLSDESTVGYEETFLLFPVEAFISEEYPMSLSTRFKNTLSLAGETGGTGFLDGVVTLTQPVGCVVAFVVSGVQSEYVLEPYTDEAGDGFVQPLDFDADTNAKIWRKI